MRKAFNLNDEQIVSEIKYTMNISFPDDPSVQVRLEFSETDEYAAIYLNEEELQLPEADRVMVSNVFQSFDRDHALFFI